MTIDFHGDAICDRLLEKRALHSKIEKLEMSY